MKSALEGRIQRAEEIANTLKHFKREVALAAEHSKTGKPIAQKLLTDMEAKGGRVAHASLQLVVLVAHASAASAGLKISHQQALVHDSACHGCSRSGPRNGNVCMAYTSVGAQQGSAMH